MIKSIDGERIANTICGLICLVPAGLAMLCIYMVYLVTCRKTGPFLYSGDRIGKDKKTYTMYKIRTLVHNVESKIGAKLYANDRSHEIWYGRFLRNTRLDELPQLFNVIRGDMDLVGPRPVRPLVYDIHLKELRDFEKRFQVRPGLTGYSQFYTPHNAPVRLRVLIDNLFIKKNTTFIMKIFFVARTAFQLLFQIGKETSHLMTKISALKRNKSFEIERRRFRRKILKNTSCEFSKTNETVFRKKVHGHVIDIDSESLLIRGSAGEFKSNDQILLTILFTTKKGGRNRKQTVRCQGQIAKKRESSEVQSGCEYVVNYSSASDSAQYIIQKHLLKSTFG
jgi:lipopolysaccharide/colanic/teichoic acid biosynthesis glycosyltransferase